VLNFSILSSMDAATVRRNLFLHRSVPCRLFVQGGLLGTLAVCGLAGSTACTSDTAGLVQAFSPADTYFGLTLNQHAINMALTAPSNTIQLTATALNALNHPLANAGQATFTTLDSCVTVTASGLVTARFATLGQHTGVVARLQQDNVTYVDTAYIRVTETAPAAIALFSIQPPLGDSAIRGGIQYTPTVTATDVNGQPVEFDLHINGTNTNYVWFTSSNPYVSDYNRANGSFGWADTGHVTLYATAWVYGVPVHDSLKFLMTWQLFLTTYQTSESSCLWYRCTAFLGVGGRMVWSNFSPDAHDLVFDDPLAVDSAPNFNNVYSGRGNIHFPANLDGRNQSQARSFPKAGTYHWRNPLNPVESGVIFVLENPK
jgi:hypothetical protein